MAEETPTTQEDWIANATNQIIDVIDKAKVKGTDNAVLVVRGIVFGLVGIVFGVAALVFTVVVMVRLADAYLPIGAGVGDATWAAHLFIGTLLAVLGFGLWGCRKGEGVTRLWMALIVNAIIVVVIVCYGIFA